MDVDVFVNSVWPFVAVIIPFVTARLTNPEARRIVKFAVALGLSAFAGLITAAGMDWSPVPWADLGTRVAAIFGVCHATYVGLDALLDNMTDADFNDTVGGPNGYDG